MDNTKLRIDTKDCILDLIYFADPEFDSEFLNLDVSPEELFETLGLSDLLLVDILDLLKEGSRDIEEAFKSGLFEEKNSGMERYHRIGIRFAPVALAVYDRLLKKGEEPRLPIYLAVNRSQSTQSHPEAVLFWADVDAIRGLYQSLKKDGYYEKQ